MPYYGRRKSSTRYKSARKSYRKPTARKAARTYRRRKYTKVSRRRPSWTSGTVVSPYRKFTYNDEDYAFTLSNLLPYTWKLFRGNSCYDPDYDVGGVQPYGFDQLCPTFYENYCVKGSKITIYPFISLSNVIMPQRLKFVVVPYHNTTLPYTEYSDIIQLPFAKSVLMGWYSNDDRTIKLSSYCKSSYVLGKNVAADKDAVAQYNANPTDPWYWFVFCYSGEPVGAGDNITVKYDVKITYYTVLSQKTEIDNS